MSPEGVAAVMAGVTSLIVAVGTLLTNRSKRVVEDAGELRGQVITLQGQMKDALGHIYRLELAMAARGIDAPERPASLVVLAGGKNTNPGRDTA